MTEYEQVKSAIEQALSHTKAALKLVKENGPPTSTAPKGVLAFVHAMIEHDPREAVIATLTNSIYELNAANDANERMNKIL